MDILLVEDNEADARLVLETFLEINKTVRLHLVTDGLEAIAFLRYQEPYFDAPRPDLILLDLRLPKLDGLEVLAKVKEDPWLKTIPIVVLTSSKEESDIVQTYTLMASCYLTKPQNWDEFESLVKSLNDFWLAGVTLPKKGRTARRL